MGFPYDRVFVGRHTKYPVFFHPIIFSPLFTINFLYIAKIKKRKI